MRNQLWSIFVTRLAKVDFVADPQGGPFLPVASIQIKRGVDLLSGLESRFSSPSPTLVERLELLFPDRAQRDDSGESFQPVRGTGSIERLKQGPSIRPYLIGVLLASSSSFGKRSCSSRSPYRCTHSVGT